MKPYDMDVPSMRAHVARCRLGIFTGTDAQLVKQQGTGMVQSIFGDSPLAGEAGRLPAPTMVGLRSRTPLPRDERFNLAFDALMARIDQAFSEIEDYQRRRSHNVTVPKAEIRDSVLAFFARKPMDMQWGTAALFELGLSEDQTLDALHFLEDHALIEYGGKHVYSGGDWQWQVQLTTQGRDRADGTLEVSSALAAIVVQHFHAPVANAGTVHGNVVQNNTTFPPLPPDVRAKLVDSPAGEALVDALEEEQKLPQPRKDKVRKLAAGVKNIMENANTATDFWNHLTDWCGEIGTWLDGAL